MDIFGFTITRTKASPGQLNSVESRGGWWPLLRESYAGAWQENVTVELANVLTYSTVFACISLIASDIAKMNLRLVSKDDNGIWTETENSAYSPVLRKPNRYQNRIKFVEQWIMSKLIHGNTYALKQRDLRGVVTALYVLDPQRVRPLVAEDGAVYYELKRDDLSSQHEAQIIVPAREIIHDVMVALYHPLVGVSPIHACGLAAVQGLKIQSNTANLFANGSNPGGVLTAPGSISEATAQRLKAYWDANYTGANVGKVAVLGDGLKFEKMVMSAVDAQLIEQLKWTSEAVCSVYHVPPYMVGVGTAPAYNNIQALNQQYYSQALQSPVESLELCLDEGLEIKRPLGTEFDIDDLLRMDTATQVTTLAAAVGGALYSPNEARKKLNQPPVKGGNTPYLQQQNYSLEALNKRDTQADPFKTATPAQPAAPPDKDDERDDVDEAAETAKFAAALFTKMANIHAA